MKNFVLQFWITFCTLGSSEIGLRKSRCQKFLEISYRPELLEEYDHLSSVNQVFPPLHPRSRFESSTLVANFVCDNSTLLCSYESGYFFQKENYVGKTQFVRQQCVKGLPWADDQLVLRLEFDSLVQSHDDGTDSIDSYTNLNLYTLILSIICRHVLQIGYHH